VILRQTTDVVLERVEAGGGDDARLAHRAAEDLPRSPCLLNEFTLPKKKRARRAPQPLRQAGRHRIEPRAQILDPDLLLDRGIEDARAVQMRGETSSPRQRESLLEVISRQNAAGNGVLQREQARLGEVRVVGLDRRLDLG
jgi:hypothetical protein